MQWYTRCTVVPIVSRRENCAHYTVTVGIHRFLFLRCWLDARNSKRQSPMPIPNSINRNSINNISDTHVCCSLLFLLSLTHNFLNCFCQMENEWSSQHILVLSKLLFTALLQQNTHSKQCCPLSLSKHSFYPWSFCLLPFQQWQLQNSMDACYKLLQQSSMIKGIPALQSNSLLQHHQSSITSTFFNTTSVSLVQVVWCYPQAQCTFLVISSLLCKQFAITVQWFCDALKKQCLMIFDKTLQGILAHFISNQVVAFHTIVIHVHQLCTYNAPW